jgi:hypothetical protein
MRVGSTSTLAKPALLSLEGYRFSSNAPDGH